MNIEPQNISIFFFGSPGEGFSSHPTEHLSYVKALDRSQEDYELVCNYIVERNKSTIKYIEYGLTGNGQDGTARGGRNFGIWIQIRDFKFEKKHHHEIIPHIKVFIEEVLIDVVKIFDKKGETLNYNIFSFDEVRGTLDKLITPFIEHFIEDFNDYLTPISEKDLRSYNLNKKEEETISTAVVSINETSQDENQNDAETSDNKVDDRIVSKIIDILKKLKWSFLWLLVLGLLVSHIYHINKSKEFRENIYKELKKIKRFSNQSPFEDQDDDLADRHQQDEEQENKALMTQQNRLLVYIVKRGENLGSIVRAYNDQYKTIFTTKQIATYNDIEVKVEGGRINYPLKINQKINFPEK